MLIWYAAGAVAAIVVAWVAAIVHASGHAPLGLVSLVVGIALGGVLFALAATQRIASRRRLIVGTFLLAIVAVLGEHTWLYLDFRRQWQEARANSPQVAIFRSESPWSPREYFKNEATPGRTLLWCADALTLIASATATLSVLRHNRLGRHLTPDT
jgi:hypothetical protein